ncbi:MAG: DUF799 domain-containing protein [Burkholderiales bacterium]|jgi:hypothetical protein|nr:DUF799 domain-containing protein [Burkholderiales bacterium]
MSALFFRHLFTGASLVLALSLSACATTHHATKNYEMFRAENPRSILVVPATNQTTDVDAPDYFLSTVAVPLAERGYYVFPVFMVQQILSDDGLSDADLVHAGDPVILANLFGADAVLYVKIERWDARFILLQTEVTVAFSYTLKSGKTGQALWTDHQSASYRTGNQNNGILTSLISAALGRAMPSYVPLARQANQNSVFRVGQGLPAGPYDTQYLKDQEAFGKP